MELKMVDVIKEAKSVLDCKSVTHYNDTIFLLEKVLGHKVSALDNITITEQQYNEYMSLIGRRAKHEPMDSLFGFTEFLELKIPFSVDTLSPRQETEIMTDNIIKENSCRTGLKILDLCSGSGCIGLAVAKWLDADVTLADISDKALLQIANNAKLNNINVNIVKSDLFGNIQDKFDIIITNPPYIPTAVCSTLEKEVKDFDPILALDGGHDGLDLIRKIASQSADYLEENGLIYMEYGIGQTEEIVKLFEEHFDNIEIVKDYSGIDRYIKARKRDLC